MLQTIEVEIDAKGHIHPLEKLPLPLKGKSRALLTILPADSAIQLWGRKLRLLVS